MRKQLSQQVDQSLTEDEYQSGCSAIQNAINSVKERIICKTIDYRIVDAEAYIRHQQAAAIFHADSLLHYMLPGEVDKLHKQTTEPSRSALRRLLFHELKNFLDFLADYYKKYFDHDADVPVLCRIMVAKELSDKLTIIKDTLYKAGISDMLMEITCAPLQTFVSNDSAKATFRETNHLSQLATDLMQLKDKINEKDPDGSLHQLLQSINFITKEFTEYTDRYFTSAPNTTFPSIPGSSSKIKLKLTVPQIAHIIYLVKEILSFPDKSLENICEFVCAHFCSAYTGNIAPGSLRSQVYRYEGRTGLSIQTILAAMQALSKKRCS